MNSIVTATPTPTEATAEFWLRPSSYFQPAHIVVSAWLEHAPFAAWLVDVLRPQTAVELGTHYGFSCFAFAEAAKRLDVDLTVHALDTWQGDDHAGFYDESVFDAVRSVVAQDYPGGVVMHRGLFASSRDEFEDGSVDLLHIDGRHGYEDVVEDFEMWRTVVRPGGVILFHDIAERQEGFGVWRLWEELEQQGPTFAFAHGHGLGILAVGEPEQGPLRALFDADQATAARIRADYERLGAVVSRQYAVEESAAQADDLRATVQGVQGENAALRAQLETISALKAHADELVWEREAWLAELRSSTSWRVTAPLRAAGRFVHRFRH